MQVRQLPGLRHRAVGSALGALGELHSDLCEATHSDLRPVVLERHHVVDVLFLAPAVATHRDQTPSLFAHAHRARATSSSGRTMLTVGSISYSPLTGCVPAAISVR